MKGGIIIGILLASILVVAVVGEAIEYFKPELPIPIRPDVSTLVINTAKYSQAYGYFATFVKIHKLEVDWSQNLGDGKWIGEELLAIFKNDVYFGEIESGKYDKVIFPISTVRRTMYPAFWFELNSAIEIPMLNAKFCRENNIRTIGVNFVSRIANYDGGYFDPRDDEKATYDVINEFAKYFDVLLVHYTEIVDSRYYDLAEKYGFELIILGGENPYSSEYWYSEIARCLKEMGI